MKKHLFVIGMMLIGILMVSGCVEEEKSEFDEEYWDDFIDDVTPQKVRITVESSSLVEKVSISYTFGDFSTSYDTYMTSFDRTMTGFPGSWYYLSVQNQGSYGTITAKLYVDGKLEETDTTSRSYGIASVSVLL